MAKITKAQKGKTVASKDSVPSEMFPGKMIPKSKSNYETGRMAKGMKPAAPKKKMKEGGKVKKARTGATLAPSKKSTSTNLASYKRVIGKSMRDGGSMKKCKYGCK